MVNINKRKKPTTKKSISNIFSKVLYKTRFSNFALQAISCLMCFLFSTTYQILFLILIIRSVSQRQRFRLVRGRVEVEGTQVAAPEYRIVPSSVTTSSSTSSTYSSISIKKSYQYMSKYEYPV